MADSLKTFFSRALVAQMAETLSRAHRAFPKAAFVRDASRGLDDLELLDRGRHIARAMHKHLPSEYPSAVDVLIRSMGDEHATAELEGVGMAPFFYLPHAIFVAEHGLEHFDLSMRAQCEITKRFTAEWSMRPFITHDPERSMAQLMRWAKDRNPHVRRLVSECTRLRLPWAGRVAWLDANPERIVELLERLKDDPATAVRRSVANNLNDLGKVRPELLMRTCRAWMKNASAERRALIEHALRSAVKRGHRDALSLLGYGKKASVQVQDVTFTPNRVAIGERVKMGFALKSTARSRQDVLVDVAVHFVKAKGHTAPKVFKLKRVTLAPGERVELALSVSLAVHTTRKPYPGKHAVHVLLNGVSAPIGAFQVFERA